MLTIIYNEKTIRVHKEPDATVDIDAFIQIEKDYDKVVAENERFKKRCKKCGNWLRPDEDVEDIYACPCCATSAMQKTTCELQTENEKLKEQLVLSESQNYCKICGKTLDGYEPKAIT